MENKNANLARFVWRRVSDIVGPKPRPRHGHRVVEVRKHLMVVFGGGNEGMHDGLHVFDIETGKWHIPIVKGHPSPGRAAFGFVAVGKTRIIVFGGMMEFGKYSSDVLELEASRWEWKCLHVMNGPHQPQPCARFGHSFTLINDDVFMFGGCTEPNGGGHLVFLNDLYILKLQKNGSVFWHLPKTFGPSPPCRESHSAVAYTDSLGNTKLIIYGGMNGQRLGDIWTLQTSSMQWSNHLLCGKVPRPRSLHTATVISQHMFIFGGWVPRKSTDYKDFECSNELACLNLETMVWGELLLEADDKRLPRPRAGHSAIAMNSGIYIWSGRDGYNKAWNNQVCLKDMWYLELKKPPVVKDLQLQSSSANSLTLNWTKVDGVENYLLQVMKCSNEPVRYCHPPGNIFVAPPASCDSCRTPQAKSSLVPTKSADSLPSPSTVLQLQTPFQSSQSFKFMNQNKTANIQSPARCSNLEVKIPAAPSALLKCRTVINSQEIKGSHSLNGKSQALNEVVQDTSMAQPLGQRSVTIISPKTIKESPSKQIKGVKGALISSAKSIKLQKIPFSKKYVLIGNQTKMSNIKTKDSINIPKLFLVDKDGKKPTFKIVNSHAVGKKLIPIGEGGTKQKLIPASALTSSGLPPGTRIFRLKTNKKSPNVEEKKVTSSDKVDEEATNAAGDSKPHEPTVSVPNNL